MSARVSIYIPCALVCILFDSKHSLELLSHLYRPVVLFLRNFSRVKHLLNLLLRVAFEILTELLKLAHEVVGDGVSSHFVVQWIHCPLLSNVPVFARFQPVAR